MVRLDDLARESGLYASDQAEFEAVNSPRSSSISSSRVAPDAPAFPEAAEAQELNPRGLVVAAEAYTIHQARLAAHFEDYDPIVRQRLIQGRRRSSW